MPTLISQIADEVKRKLEGEGSGHDWWHILRVWTMAKRIGAEEGAEMTIVELGALLHDIADWKFTGGDETAGPREARALLEKFGAPEETIEPVTDIVEHISYKGAGVASEMRSLEGRIVQDADRLDAIGAIGIARCFAYGGHKSRAIWDPNEKPVLHQTKEAYMKSTGSSVNHFYEKLLLLKDRMNTATGRKIAEARHRFTEQYLNEFYSEWDGKR